MNKGLTRLIIFVVFLIPVSWYLILQLFGDNRFELTLLEPISATCDQFDSVAIVAKDDSLTTVKTNYMNRVNYALEKRKAILITKPDTFFSCINQSSADLVLVSEEGLWGAYELSREGVDQLLTELDILRLQQSYGEGTHR